MFSLPMN